MIGSLRKRLGTYHCSLAAKLSTTPYRRAPETRSILLRHYHLLPSRIFVLRVTPYMAIFAP